MVVLSNGLMQCPKCKGSKRYTPIGLTKHYADVHPVKLQTLVSPRQLEDPCPLGGELSCCYCFFAVGSKCRFNDFKSRIGDR